MGRSRQEGELEIVKRQLEAFEAILPEEDFQRMLEDVDEIIKRHMRKVGMEVDEY